MNVLVTGGAGFIGSNFIRLVLSDMSFHKVVCLDKLTYSSNVANFAELHSNERFEFVKGCISDLSLIEKTLEAYTIDLVINFAAETHVDRSISGSAVFIETNIVGTHSLLEACKKYWTIGFDNDGYPIYRQNTKFVQISTDEVYGSIEGEGSFSELSQISPNSPYAASKASADMLVMSYSKTFKMPINITRCSNNYGQFQFPEKLIPLMIQNALDNKQLPVYGDGMQVRDWIHVEDHCKAILCVITNGVDGEIYNVGANNEVYNLDIVKEILNIIEKPYSLISYVQDRLGHDRRYSIDNSKILKLGWRPEINFHSGLLNTVQWYKDNQDYWTKRDQL